MARDLSLSSLEKKKGRGDLIAVCNYLIKGLEKMEMLFLEVHSDKTRAMGTKLDCGKFQTEIRKQYFYYKSGQIVACHFPVAFRQSGKKPLKSNCQGLINVYF